MSAQVNVEFTLRGSFLNEELCALHAEAFATPVRRTDWLERVRRHSLGWVTAREGGALVGFVNVAWDGGEHAFIVDTMVASTRRRQGVGKELVNRAAAEARAAGCRYVHVDFEPGLTRFYFDACGFRPTAAGLLRL